MEAASKPRAERFWLSVSDGLGYIMPKLRFSPYYAGYSWIEIKVVHPFQEY